MFVHCHVSLAPDFNRLRSKLFTYALQYGQLEECRMSRRYAGTPSERQLPLQ